MNAPMFDFNNTLGTRNSVSQHRAAVSGMTMTIYDSRFALTNSVLDALDNPEKIDIIYEEKLKAFCIFADPEGMAVRKGATSTKQFSARAVKKILQDNGYDFTDNFYRATDGRRYGECVLFSTENLIAVKREVRNG